MRPTGVSATAADGQATVSFTAPSADGSAISGYTVTATDTTDAGNGGQAAAGSGSPITVTGLTDGDSYTFTVTATNGNGTGPASAASAPVTPTGPPDAPTGVTATGGDRSATVSWTAAGDEGSPVTGYQVTASPGGATCTTATTSCVVPGLTNGTTYTFTVTATNGNGTGAASDPSNAVTPITVPDAPTDVVAEAGNASATVTWTAAGDEGSPITGYTVTSSAYQTCTTSTTTCVFTGLVNGEAYSFTVTATNAQGTGPASAESNTVTPSTVPDAPTNVVATAGNASASVTWTPAGREGSPILSYTATASPGGSTCVNDPDRLVQLHRSDQRHGLHLHGDGHQRRRHRGGLGPFGPGHTLDGPRRPDRRGGHGRQRLGDRQLDGRR